MSVTEETFVGQCPICEINVYDLGPIHNRVFEYLGVQRLGSPRLVAMPCGIDKTGSTDSKLRVSQKIRCPFETKEEQDAIEYKKGLGIFSGENGWDRMG